MIQQQKNSKFKRGFKKWSDEKSTELRLSLGLKNISPLCGFELCNYLKIPVLTPYDVKDLPSKELNHLLNEGSEFWSAASIPISEDKYIILHNPDHSASRQQSNLMHELAHVICGHKIDKEKIDIGLSGFLRNHNAEQENEAEWFGACLQLPRPALIWALKRGMTEEEISKYFNASIEMTRYRINITGVKRQLKYSQSYK